MWTNGWRGESVCDRIIYKPFIFGIKRPNFLVKGNWSVFTPKIIAEEGRPVLYSFNSCEN